LSLITTRFSGVEFSTSAYTQGPLTNPVRLKLKLHAAEAGGV